MKNIYLIISAEMVTYDSQINEIIQKNPDSTVLRYDLEEVPIEKLIEDLDTYNFLENKKIVVGLHASFLNGDKKDAVSHNLHSLEKYLKNPNPDNILILVTDSVDKRKKIVTELLANCEVIEKELSMNDVIMNHLEDYEMDRKAINLLIEYCQDKERVITELEKLKLYKLEEKKITEEDIKEIVSKNIDDNIFTLVDFIINGKKKEAFEVYNELLLHGEQVANIIPKLANKIRLIYQVKVFLSEGKSDLEISKLLKMHPYPIKLAREVSYKYSDKLILEYLNKLADLDYDLKSGKGSPNIIFETFIAEI